MKRSIFLIVIVFISISTCIAQDHIIFRNGTESDIKLYQINDEKIIYGLIGDRTGRKQEISSKDVYMVYIEKQSNVYINQEGKRITGESKRADVKRKNVIYLTRGAEIAADDVIITDENITYSIKAQKKGFAALKKGDNSQITLNKAEVFMIRYKSGIIDVITKIENTRDTIADTKHNTESTEEQQPEYVVLFHPVAKGENLNIISKKYNVTTKEIIEWNANELSPRIKPTSPLTTGMQLMIYQPKK